MTTNATRRVQRYRDRLRAAGLRPVQIWVPDTTQPAFAEACRHQSRLVCGDPQESETLNWLAAAADTSGWE